MLQIKGTALDDAIQSIKTSFGEEGYREIISGTDTEYQKILRQRTIALSDWFPFEALIQLLEAG